MRLLLPNLLQVHIVDPILVHLELIGLDVGDREAIVSIQTVVSL